MLSFTDDMAAYRVSIMRRVRESMYAKFICNMKIENIRFEYNHSLH